MMLRSRENESKTPVNRGRCRRKGSEARAGLVSEALAEKFISTQPPVPSLIHLTFSKHPILAGNC